MNSRVTGWLERLSVSQRFLLGSLGILTVCMAGVGAWVSTQIEDSVVHRTAATTALYVDSLISPSLQDLTEQPELSKAAVSRLDWLIADTALGQQITVFQVWDREGRIVYSTMGDLVGKQFPVDNELAKALAGEITGDVGQAEGAAESLGEVARQNLIEIYSPVRNPETGDVIAAAEFYYATDELQQELASARKRSWLAVGGATLLIYLLLATFIRGISDRLRRQQLALADQVARLTEVGMQNRELHERVRGAAARTAALNERLLRRVSAELHDGPAQEISLALLRLDQVAALNSASGDVDVTSAMQEELDLIQLSLRRSLDDVRAVSSGLHLPILTSLTVPQTLDHVVRGHHRRTGTAAQVTRGALPEQAALPTKIALYRIVQEALNNAWRHAPGATPTVEVQAINGEIALEISDTGPGFDPAASTGSSGHLGLIGMRERAESLGGEFRVISAPDQGTRVIASLPIHVEGSSYG